MTKKKGNDSPTPEGARGRKSGKKPAAARAPKPASPKAAKPARKSRAKKKEQIKTTAADEQPVTEKPGALNFKALTGHRKGQRRVPVEISLREASDAADRAMEISGLLRSAQANLSIVKQRQKRVVEEASAQIETIQSRFDEEAEKWSQRKAPKVRTGIWGFDLTAKDAEFPLGKKWFACSDTGRIHGPDAVTKDDLENLKQEAMVHPGELAKASMLAPEDDAPTPDVVITPDMLGLTEAQNPLIGNCGTCDVGIHPQDGHYMYKNLLFCAKDSLCGKCGRMVLLDRDEFHRVVKGENLRVCSECAEELDATGTGTHTPKSNRKQMRDAAQTPTEPPPQLPLAAPAAGADQFPAKDDDDDDVTPVPQTALVPHEFIPSDAHPEFCGVDFCSRQQTDPIHDLGEDDEEMP